MKLPRLPKVKTSIFKLVLCCLMVKTIIGSPAIITNNRTGLTVLVNDWKEGGSNTVRDSTEETASSNVLGSHFINTTSVVNITVLETTRLRHQGLHHTKNLYTFHTGAAMVLSLTNFRLINLNMVATRISTK